MSVLHDLTRVRQLLRPERGRYTIGLGALFLVNFADAFAPVFLAVAIDLTEAALTKKPPKTPQLLELIGISSDTFSLMGAILLYLLFLLVANISRYPMLMNTAVPSHQIGQSLRQALTARLLKQSQPYYDRAKSGDLMSLATADIQAIRMMLGPGILVGTDTIFLLGLVLLVMFGMSWQLSLVALIPLPFIAIITNLLSHAEFKRFEAVQEDLADMTERTRESYAGIRIIQGYAQEPYDQKRFDRYSFEHYLKNLRLARVRALFDPTLDWMMGASIALVFVFGGLGVLKGTITLGTFIAFIFLINYLSGPMIGFGWAISLFQRGRASLGRFDAFMNEPVEIQDAPDATIVEGDGALIVQNLSFAYAGKPVEDDEDDSTEAQLDTQEPIIALSDISFDLPAGQTLGIIGPVGSGKSTLVRLLVRLYEPPEDTILLDGQDVRKVTLESLRENIVLAPQESFLFSDTVERNVLLGGQFDRDPTIYTQQAHLHDELLGLNDGYQTMLGERGVNLSGGQRQRLAIARAIAADPKVLLLDDCLSAVDARTEEAILQNLAEVFHGRTGIIVSHRVRAVQRCDQIIVLEQGRIIERGDHASLIQKGGYYARIAMEQTQPELAHTPPANPQTMERVQ